MKNFISLSILLMMVSFLGGCALTQENVNISYNPQRNVTRIAGAEEIKLKVEVTDAREIKDILGYKVNSLGMKGAPFFAENNVVDILKKAIESEFASQGFVLATPNSVSLHVVLTKYFSKFKLHPFSATGIAELTMNVQVRTADGSTAFSKNISAEGDNPSGFAASPENAKIALNNALKNAVVKLASDQSIRDAIFSATR